jgi:hypothetical protein
MSGLSQQSVGDKILMLQFTGRDSMKSMHLMLLCIFEA